MTAQSGALLIHKIMALRQKEPDQCALKNIQAFAFLLAWLRNETSCQKNSLSVLCIL